MAGSRDGLRRMYVDAMGEAAAGGDRRIGTDHLLLGLLHDPDSRPATALGIGLEQARDACSQLDRGALASIGLEVDLPRPSRAAPRAGRLTLTPAARQVLSGARHEAHFRRVTPDHVALALLHASGPDPAAQVLDFLGVDRAHAETALRAC